MKTSVVGVVSVVILMVVAAVGFGIAQAGGTHADAPVLSIEDQEAIEQGSTTSSQEVPEWANPSAEDTHMASPTETGSLPDGSNADASIVEIDGVPYYLFEGKLYGPED